MENGNHLHEYTNQLCAESMSLTVMQKKEKTQKTWKIFTIKIHSLFYNHFRFNTKKMKNRVWTDDVVELLKVTVGSY